MAEITYSGRGASRGAGPSAAPPPQPAHQQQQSRGATRAQQRPSTAAARLQGNINISSPAHAAVAAGRSPEQPSAQRILAFLDSAERAAAQRPQPPVFPSDGSLASQPPQQQGQQQQERQRPKSAAPLRASCSPRVTTEPQQPHPRQAGSKTPQPRHYGRVSLYDHSTADREPHEVPGPVVLRDLAKPRVGFPSRPPEDFLRAGEGLALRQRNQLKERLKRHPVSTEAPFQPGTGGVRLQVGPSQRAGSGAGFGARPLDWGASRPRSGTLLRTYYDNGTLDFVGVRWRGSRADALVWARGVTKGPEAGGPHTRSYTSWAPEPPSELDLPTWLPIFIDGVREYDEPYRFLAIRGSEELLLKAGDTLHSFAEALVAPLRAVLDTREPTCVAVGLQLMHTALGLDPHLADRWAPHYWQFAQVLNLFASSRAGSLLVDMGYNSRSLASCRRLAGDFMTAFELAGGPAAAAALRRYSPAADAAVTEAVMARAAAKAAAREAEAGRQPGAFKPFTLF